MLGAYLSQIVLDPRLDLGTDVELGLHQGIVGRDHALPNGDLEERGVPSVYIATTEFITIFQPDGGTQRSWLYLGMGSN